MRVLRLFFWYLFATVASFCFDLALSDVSILALNRTEENISRMFYVLEYVDGDVCSLFNYHFGAVSFVDMFGHLPVDAELYIN